MTAPDEKYRKVILRCTPASTGTQPVLDAPSVIPHAASCEYPFWSMLSGLFTWPTGQKSINKSVNAKST